jgi:hypothetical protein
MMSLSLRVASGESKKSLERRARILHYRISRGEFIPIQASDPVADVYLELATGKGFRVAHGNAAGAVPEVL